jgi:hypothetical protein
MKTKIFTMMVIALLLIALVGCSSNTPPTATTPVGDSTPADTTISNEETGLTEEYLLSLPEDPVENCRYVEKDGEIYITGYSVVENGIAVIPSEIEGKPVTQINGAFEYNNSVKIVIIPENVTTIGESAFSSLSIETVIFKGNNVIEISQSAFASCESLKKIDLPNSITTIGVGAFNNCSNLKEISLPSNLKVILSGAFAQTAIVTLKLPEGLETIGARAFSMCDKLKSVSIPSTVQTIGDDIFGSGANKNDVTIITPSGSYAEQYAKDNDIKVVNE